MSSFSQVTPLAYTDQKKGSVAKDQAGVHFDVREQLGIVQVFASKGNSQNVAEKLSIGARAGQATITGELTALPLSPGQWMMCSESGRDGSLRRELSERLSGIGHVSEQSHGRIVIRISGAKARQLMQKGCRLDLHPRVATGGFCAQTNMAQTGVIIHQLDDAPVYDVMLYSGFASSFWHWLVESASEYGFSV